MEWNGNQLPSHGRGGGTSLYLLFYSFRGFENAESLLRTRTLNWKESWSRVGSGSWVGIGRRRHEASHLVSNCYYSLRDLPFTPLLTQNRNVDSLLQLSPLSPKKLQNIRLNGFLA
jgi:hypothetical protein